MHVTAQCTSPGSTANERVACRTGLKRGHIWRKEGFKLP